MLVTCPLNSLYIDEHIDTDKSILILILTLSIKQQVYII